MAKICGLSELVVFESSNFSQDVGRGHNASSPSVFVLGVTCKKIPFYMGDSACRWRIFFQNANKIF